MTDKPNKNLYNALFGITPEPEPDPVKDLSRLSASPPNRAHLTT
jgi:hypothetical protein